MAESSLFWTTGTTGDGKDTYGETQFSQWLRASFTTDSYTEEGVIPGPGTNLLVSGTTTTLTVGAGAAYVNGFYYTNSGAFTVGVSAPAAGSTAFRVNLAADVIANTVRAVVVQANEGSTTIPSLTQQDNNYWEIPLATGLVSSGGTVTLSDARVFVRLVQAPVWRRRGGSSSEWSTQGSTNYTPGAQRILGGTTTLVFNDDTDETGDYVNFPLTFSGKPLVWATVMSAAVAAHRAVNISVYSLEKNRFRLVGRRTTGGDFDGTVQVYWLAIGPK
jgi:hypothetical protein